MTWKRGHALFAALSFFVPLLAYIRTITPTVPFWDSGEFIATSYILGLPHPPGNPVYTMLGRMMTFLPFETIAWRVNFMSSLASALTCFFTYLFTARAIRRTFGVGSNEEMGEDAAPASDLTWLSSCVGGLVAALFLAFGSSFWDSAIEAEVYSLSSAIIAFVVWLAFVWWDRQGEPGNDKLLVLIVYILGVSTGVHLGTILIAPSLLVLFWMVRPGTFFSPKFMVPFLAICGFIVLLYLNGALDMGLSDKVILGILGLGILYALVQNKFFIRKNLVAWWVLVGMIGITVQLFLLIRSQQMPNVNEGAPTTLGTWLEYLSRKQYGPADPFDRRAEVWYQIQHMYLRYVGQQWHLIERLGNLDLGSFWVRLVNAVPYLLFFTGAFWNYRRDRKSFWFFLATHIIMGPALIFYLNFTDHEVRERDYFFTNSYHFIAVWIGIGAAAALHALAGALAPAREAVAREDESAAAAGAAPLPSGSTNRAVLGLGALTLAGLALLPMRNNWFEHDRSGFYIAHDYAYNMLEPLEPNAVVFTNGDNDTFPLWYIQEVEKVRKDVRVVNLSLLNTPWYIQQLRDQEPKVPISFTNAQLAVMGPYQDPQTGQIVWVKDLAVKDIVKTNQWKKPLYLAVTVPDQMGMEKQLSLEGLVFRIEPKETQKSVDLEKTMHNLYSTFKYGGLLDKNRAYDTTVYKDENAYRLVQNYTAAHVQAAYQLQLAQRNQEAVKVLEDAVKISPDFPGLLEYLGKLYEDTGHPDKAEQIYLEGVSRFPTQPEYHYHLGILWYQTGRVDPGIAELRKAAELNQQYFDWFSALFTALWQTGRRAEAVDVLRTWVRAHPEDQQGAGYLKVYEESLRVLGSAPPAHVTPGRG